MSPNEKFALALLRIVGERACIKLTKGPEQIDWGAIGELEKRASGGERALLDTAIEAWGCRGGIAATLARVDSGLRVQVISALADSYEVE